ncbi:hypothetical protein LAZ67_2004493 [Cordylochernes scorpioides]|uniref:Transposase n=1 Tax=Cordylochernes scorpioides TaxID=51811 RepID=A0ABY6K6N9_9ARAC|nr:hypothetical protein LAZ67_2004493 [Cordylochernes scorpioides]
MILVKDAQNFKGLMKMCKKITDLIKENPRTTLLELEQDTGISKTTIGRIVTEDLKLKKTPAKFIPRFLTNEQKLCRLATCEDMMEMTRTDPEWKDKIITGDETWVYGYDPETKPQSAEWRGRRRSRDIIRVDSIDNLGVRRLNAVLVPKDLTSDQKNARKETASLNLEATTDDPELLKRVITGDETWIYGFDSETTQQALEWRFKNEPRPKKARKAPSKVKVMLTVFFDYKGIVHHEFQQQGSTITADSYIGVLRRLREAIRQKRPELWRSKSCILHHDNAPAHTALKISKFLQDHSTSVFPQPPYSPDLAPCDFFLFGKLKKS